MNFVKSLNIKNLFAVSLSICVLMICAVFLSGCGKTEDFAIDYDTALEYVWELQDHVEKTGNTDIYQYFLESMDKEYLDGYVMDTYSFDIEDTYLEGYAEGYEEGFDDGSRLVIDYMDDEYREKWWNENIDIIMKYGIEY